jgi:hypothetical protein
MMELTALESRKRIDRPEPVALRAVAAEVAASAALAALARGVALECARRGRPGGLGRRVPAPARACQPGRQRDRLRPQAAASRSRSWCIRVATTWWYATRARDPDFAEGKVFEKVLFARAPASAKKSTGLGLSFVKEIAELHHGRATLKNQRGGGAVASPRCRAVDARETQLASVSSKSAWHGPLRAHQQARFLPASAARSASFDGGSTPPGAAISPRIQRPCCATAIATLPHSAIVNGLPQRVVRSTLTVLGGIFQPALRLSWTRCGMPARPAATLALIPPARAARSSCSRAPRRPARAGAAAASRSRRSWFASPRPCRGAC